MAKKTGSISGRPPADAFQREYGYLIRKVIDGDWTIPQLKAMIALAYGSNRKEAAEKAEISLAILNQYFALPGFRDNVYKISNTVVGMVADELVGTMIGECMVKMTDTEERRVLVKSKAGDYIDVVDVPIIDPRLGMAIFKTRELLMKMAGRLDKLVPEDGGGMDAGATRAFIEKLNMDTRMAIASGRKELNEVEGIDDAEVEEISEQETDGRPDSATCATGDVDSGGTKTVTED